MSSDMEITENAEDIDDSEMKTEVTATKRLKIPVVEVPLTEEQLERIAEIDIFLAEHDVKVNRKKKKLLAALSVGPYETYKLGVIVANCCKVHHRRKLGATQHQSVLGILMVE